MFALDIPSDGAPAFGLGVSDSDGVEGGGGGDGGLEWRVRLCLLVSVAPPDSNPPPSSSSSHSAQRHSESETGGGVGEGEVDGVWFKGMQLDGERGEWGTGWVANSNGAPEERVGRPRPTTNSSAKGSALDGAKEGGGGGWMGYLLGNSPPSPPSPSSEVEDSSVEGGGGGTAAVDGILSSPLGGVGTGVCFDDTGYGDSGWRESRVETVECEVPVRVWPGNTVYRAERVVWDV